CPLWSTLRTQSDISRGPRSAIKRHMHRSKSILSGNFALEAAVYAETAERDCTTRTRSWPCMARSAQRPHPTGDGPPDFVRRIFLNEMDPRHRLLGQRWPPADEVDQPIIGEDRTWLSLQE